MPADEFDGDEEMVKLELDPSAEARKRLPDGPARVRRSRALCHAQAAHRQRRCRGLASALERRVGPGSGRAWRKERRAPPGHIIPLSWRIIQ